MSRVKLLSKREIDVAKARDRQREIAEGTKLANRVDGLRELAADEEKALNDFRIKTLTAIQAEIDPKIIERDELLNELVALRDERKSLLKPLDEEWLRVRAVSRELDKDAEAIAQKEAQLKLGIGTNIQREKNNEVEAQRLTDMREKTETALLQAEKMNKDAASDLMDARAKSKQLMSNAQTFEASVATRENRVTLKEVLVDERHKKNMEDEVRNAQDRLRLQSEYAMLERIKKQLK